MEAKLGQAYATHYWGAIINNNFKLLVIIGFVIINIWLDNQKDNPGVTSSNLHPEPISIDCDCLYAVVCRPGLPAEA